MPVSMTGHTDSVTALGYSADGKKFASGSVDKTLIIWDAPGLPDRSTHE
jgi:WD40 repeat protein